MCYDVIAIHEKHCKVMNYFVKTVFAQNYSTDRSQLILENTVLSETQPYIYNI